MMKIRAVIIFIIAQAALTKQHASRRSMNIAVEDRAIRCNRNMVINRLSNTEASVGMAPQEADSFFPNSTINSKKRAILIPKCQKDPFDSKKGLKQSE